MRIVIFGLARSGTTALFYLVKNSLPANTVCLFEPRAFDERAIRPGLFARLFRGRSERHVLAKILPFRPKDPADAESFSSFDRQILLVRDPRDRIVSRLLYVVYHATFVHRDESLRTFIDLLKRKESDPRSVSVRELLRVFARLNGDDFSFDAWAADQARHSVRAPLDFHDARPHLFVCRYEDMVDRNLAALENYLGLKLAADAAVSFEHARVTRTKSYGNWRHWLTDEDVAFFRPVIQPYLDRYYADADWNLSATPVIPAELGSGYVERLVREKR